MRASRTKRWASSAAATGRRPRSGSERRRDAERERRRPARRGVRRPGRCAPDRSRPSRRRLQSSRTADAETARRRRGRERRDQRRAGAGRLHAGEDRQASSAGSTGRTASRSSGPPALRAAATGTGVLVGGDAAAAVSDRFTLAAGGRRGLPRARRRRTEEEADAAHPRPTAGSGRSSMTDIVGSTRTVERVGDRAWGELVAAHEQRDQARARRSSAARRSTRRATASSPPSTARRARFGARSRSARPRGRARS